MRRKGQIRATRKERDQPKGVVCTIRAYQKDLFELKSESSAQVITADNGKSLAEAVGDVVLPKAKIGAEVVKDVLLIPGVAANLLSVSKMTAKGHTVIIDPKGCRVVARNGETIITAVETS